MNRLLEHDEFSFERVQLSALSILPQCFLQHSISILVDASAEIEIKLGEYCTSVILWRGDMIIAPYRFSIDGGNASRSEFLRVDLNPRLVERIAAELGSNAEIAPVLGAVDPLAEQTVYELDEAVVDTHISREYLQLLIETLARHLVVNYSISAWPKGRVGGFPKYLLRRTLEHIDRTVDENPSTDQIARVVGIDAQRFARGFRASTGKSFYEYVNDRRV